MRKRRWLLAIQAGVLASLIFVSDAGRPATCVVPGQAADLGIAAAPGSPNVVLINSDDQRWDTIRYMPRVRRLLAAHGVRFTNAFVTTPVCCPSRASLLTGRYAHHTGVLDNIGPDGGVAAFDDRSTIATWLDDAGYETALVGKYLNGYGATHRCDIPPGWDRWHAITIAPSEHYYDVTINRNGQIATYGDAPADYQTRLLRRIASDFLRTAREPFFLYLAPSAPHAPAIAAPRDVGAFEGVAPWRPASYDEARAQDKPWRDHVPRMRHGLRAWIDTTRQRMLETIRSLDREIGRLVALLRATGRLDRTVIVFTSDNGFLWGEHRLVSKVWPYEESIRVPLVVRVPWSTEPRVEDRPALNIDLAPTLTHLAGASATAPVDGRSLVPLLRGGDDEPWRHRFLVEWLGRDLTSTGIGPPPYSAIRSDRFLYVEYDNGWRELYDLEADPLQMRNLSDDPSMASVERRLRERLISMMASPSST